MRMEDPVLREVGGRIYAAWAGFWALLFALVGTLLLLPLLLIPRGRRERYASPVARAYGWLCTRVVLLQSPQILGQENLPSQRGYLVICNHRSWLDVAMLVYATDSVGVSKKDIFYIPFLGQGAWIVGAIFFDRRDRNSRGKVVSEALDMMAKGANIHLFPEGTRTRDGRLLPKVHLRLIEAAWERGIPVVPACTWDTEKALPAGKLWAWPGGTPGLQIAPLLRPEQFPDAHSFARTAWERVVEMARVHGADQEWG